MQNLTIDSDREPIAIAISNRMIDEGLSKDFAVSALKIAFEFDGVLDLLKLWDKEDDPKEQEEILADIQDMIDDCSQQGMEETSYIRFDDLETIGKNIIHFKDSLRLIVEKNGGIGKLSEKTGLPQPSLSRFFSSASMPRRVTLLKISKALNLSAVDIATEWTS